MAPSDPFPMRVAPAVAGRIARGEPVVALESTIITHGMPYPANVETARRVESVVRAHGAEPATIGVIEGVITVGLDEAELDALAKGRNLLKASRRDLSAAVAAKRSAGTTVAATMAIAERAGIPIFATGGIGGVHRGAETSFDISADLVELGRTKVAVVCAGAKSILDIGRTLEFLETQGVPIFGFQCDTFPAFYAASSGMKLDHRFDEEAALAKAIRFQRAVGPGGALVVAPVPAEHALPADEIEHEVAAAIRDAESDGIHGKAVTPYLLKRVVERSGGRSLSANMALIENNAALAARLAVELARP